MSLFIKQLFNKPTYPTQDLSHQVFIVTGSNTGLGKEAVRHFLRLNAAKVILAVRNEKAGMAAAREIEAATRRSGVTEVWNLDMANYASVASFLDRMRMMKRLDALVLNAGVADLKRKPMWEDNEGTITVNVVSTMFLAAAAMPVLAEKAKGFNTAPNVVVVSSEVGDQAKFPERSSTNILDTLNDLSTADTGERYQASKMLEILATRELATRYDSNAKRASTCTVNCLNPGFCKTELVRDITGPLSIVVSIMHSLFGWTAEQGSRNLVSAATASHDSHGKYRSYCANVPDNQALSKPWSQGAEGKRLQAKLWEELMVKFQGIDGDAVAYLQ